MLVKTKKIIIVGIAILAILGWGGSAFTDQDHTPNLYRTDLRKDALSQKDIPVYTYKILKKYRHNVDHFTQGLLIDNGYLYEGLGLFGKSKLLKIDLASGKVLKERELAPQYFGEGIAIFNDLIFQLTWKSNIGFIYDKQSFKVKGSFQYPTQGWGLTNNSRSLIMSNGTASLIFLDPFTMKKTKHVIVTDKRGKIGYLNELEFVNGELLANIWTIDLIARISPESGRIIGWIDLYGLNPSPSGLKKRNVLNGIAYDNANGRLYITGKCWPWIYQIEPVLMRH